jgi:hypothetical protein
MRLDRSYQLMLLEKCASAYPLPARPGALQCGDDDESEHRYAANMLYLEQHGLVDAQVVVSADGMLSFGDPAITAKGIDFLADDGGLSAILGVVTVKLHADTIRDMLLAKADASDLPAEEKSQLKKQLAALPGAALQTVATKLAQEGIDQLPNFVHWARSLIGL